MYNRREITLGIASGVVIGSAGCMDLLEDGVTAQSEPAAIEEHVVNENNLTFDDYDSHVIDEDFEIAGETRDVNINSHFTIYSKEAEDVSLDDGSTNGGTDDGYEDEIIAGMEEDAVGITIISTPSESIAGQELNPVTRMSDERLLTEFNDEMVDGEIQNIEMVNEHDVTVLGTETVANEYEIDAETDSEDDIPISVIIFEVKNEDDIILGVGGFPTGLGQQGDVLTAFTGIEHPVDNIDDR